MNLDDPVKSPPREDGVVAIQHIKFVVYADTFGELAELAASEGLTIDGLIREAVAEYVEAHLPESRRIKRNDRARLREQRSG